MLTIENCNREIRLKKGDFEIGGLRYNSWISNKGGGKGKYGALKITSEGWISPTYTFHLARKERATLRVDWKGKAHIAVDWNNDGIKSTYLFKRSGFFKASYTLFNAADAVLLTARGKFNWRKFRHYFPVEVAGSSLSDEQLHELLLYCGHALRIYGQQQAAAS